VKCFCKDGSPRTRACSSSAKEERRSTILKAAAHLFSIREYREVSIDDVARGAGLAKGTFYLYFKTKETLFLELCADAFRGWFDALEAGFSKESAAPAALASVIASTLRDRPLLRRLFALLHSVFEENVEDIALRDFKLQMLELLRRPAARIEEALELKSGQGLRIMLWTHALIVGLAQMTSREESALRLISQYPELETLHLDFNEDFEMALAAMLAGSATLLA
jgi:AcrR family transcriptional regulator